MYGASFPSRKLPQTHKQITTDEAHSCGPAGSILTGIASRAGIAGSDPVVGVRLFQDANFPLRRYVELRYRFPNNPQAVYDALQGLQSPSPRQALPLSTS